MQGWGSVALDPAAYGDAFADVYDDWYGPGSGSSVSDVEGTVAAVAALAAAVGGPLLELGIGTGRIALPLAAAGVEVHGVDASAAMLARLRAKPGGDRIPVLLGDFGAELPTVDGGFAVVLAAFNTLLNLTAPGALERCLGLVAAVLAPGGVLVVENVVPGDDPTPSGVDVRHVDEASVVLSVFKTEGRIVTGSIVTLDAGGVRLRPWAIRTAGPAELDRLAADAGLSLERRDGGWRGEPYGPDSPRYVANYRCGGRSIPGQ